MAAAKANRSKPPSAKRIPKLPSAAAEDTSGRTDDVVPDFSMDDFDFMNDGIGTTNASGALDDNVLNEDFDFSTMDAPDEDVTDPSMQTTFDPEFEISFPENTNEPSKADSKEDPPTRGIFPSAKKSGVDVPFSERKPASRSFGKHKKHLRVARAHQRAIDEASADYEAEFSLPSTDQESQVPNKWNITENTVNESVVTSRTSQATASNTTVPRSSHGDTLQVDPKNVKATVPTALKPTAPARSAAVSFPNSDSYNGSQSRAAAGTPKSSGNPTAGVDPFKTPQTGASIHDGSIERGHTAAQTVTPEMYTTTPKADRPRNTSTATNVGLASQAGRINEARGSYQMTAAASMTSEAHSQDDTQERASLSTGSILSFEEIYASFQVNLRDTEEIQEQTIAEAMELEVKVEGGRSAVLRCEAALLDIYDELQDLMEKYKETKEIYENLNSTLDE